MSVDLRIEDTSRRSVPAPSVGKILYFLGLLCWRSISVDNAIVHFIFIKALAKHRGRRLLRYLN